MDQAAREEHAHGWDPLGGDAVEVTSISRLGHRTIGDMGRAARDIAGAGYEGVELFDGSVLDGEADGFGSLRSTLDGTGLSLVAVYSGANLIFPDVSLEKLHRIARDADAEIAAVKGKHAKVAIVMHYAGNDWSQAQIAGLKAEFGKMGVDVIAVTDAGFKLFSIGNVRWRALPERFVLWNSVWKRFDRSSQAGVFEASFDMLASISDTAGSFRCLSRPSCAPM